MICPVCGKNLTRKNLKFCTNCGAMLPVKKPKQVVKEAIKKDEQSFGNSKKFRLRYLFVYPNEKVTLWTVIRAYYLFSLGTVILFGFSMSKDNGLVYFITSYLASMIFSSPLYLCNSQFRKSVKSEWMRFNTIATIAASSSQPRPSIKSGRISSGIRT